MASHQTMIPRYAPISAIKANAIDVADRLHHHDRDDLIGRDAMLLQEPRPQHLAERQDADGLPGEEIRHAVRRADRDARRTEEVGPPDGLEQFPQQAGATSTIASERGEKSASNARIRAGCRTPKRASIAMSGRKIPHERRTESAMNRLRPQ